ncbi:MAG TPA: DUF5047 domain-containing protein [Jiangellales bacterium]|nr:DUF5047 domain-containing protein [Jiangellales bacterium]
MSDAFLRAVRGSHPTAFRARVCTTFETGVEPFGTEIPVLGGQVELNGTADIRGTLTLTTEGDWPSSSDTLLLPYGNEVFAERGIEVDGVVEWCPLGYYRINGPDQDDAPDGPIVLEGSDRMAGIVDGKLTGPRDLPSALTYGAAVEDLVGDIYPTAVIEWDDATEFETLGRNVMVERDRFAGLRDLIASVGKIVYFDHRGILVVEDLPDPTLPVFTVDHGEGGVLLNLSRQLSRHGVFNAVVAEGEAATTDTPVRVVRIDNDPGSPTYWFGSFGKVPDFISSPLLTTVTRARKAADKRLRESVGLPYTVDFSMVPNPALVPWDPVSVHYSEVDIETHVLQSITIPLTEDSPITADTREQTVVIIADEP